MYDNSNDPNLAISFLNKAIEKAADKDGVPAHYYYTLVMLIDDQRSW